MALILMDSNNNNNNNNNNSSSSPGILCFQPEFVGTLSGDPEFVCTLLLDNFAVLLQRIIRKIKLIKCISILYNKNKHNVHGVKTQCQNNVQFKSFKLDRNGGKSKKSKTIFVASPN